VNIWPSSIRMVQLIASVNDSVWYFAKRKALGHRHHCEICHPRYRNGSTRTRVKHFMMSSGLLPQNRQLKTAFYR